MFLEAPFVSESRPFSQREEVSSPSLAQSALKVLSRIVVGTPNDTYEEDEAAMVLQQIVEKNVEKAMNNLLSRNILSKLVRQRNCAIPGRTLKTSEA